MYVLGEAEASAGIVTKQSTLLPAQGPADGLACVVGGTGFGSLLDESEAPLDRNRVLPRARPPYGLAQRGQVAFAAFHELDAHLREPVPARLEDGHVVGQQPRDGMPVVA